MTLTKNIYSLNVECSRDLQSLQIYKNMEELRQMRSLNYISDKNLEQKKSTRDGTFLLSCFPYFTILSTY